MNGNMDKHLHFALLLSLPASHNRLIEVSNIVLSSALRRTGRYTLVLIDREPFRVRDLSQYTAARSVASTRTIKTELKSRDGNF